MRFYRAFVLSFFSQSLYREVAQRWRRIGLTYLFLLQAICLVAIIFRLSTNVNEFVRVELPPILDQVPTITIENGVASTPEERMYEIVSPRDNRPIAVIDTTGNIKSLADAESDILVTQQEVRVRISDRETRSFGFEEFDSVRLERSTIDGWLATSQSLLPYVTYPLALLWYFPYRVIQVFVYALIGYVASRGQEPRLGSASMMRLATVALTPVLVFEAGMRLLGLPFPPFWGLLGIGVAFGYLSFAVQANASNSPST